MAASRLNLLSVEALHQRWLQLRPGERFSFMLKLNQQNADRLQMYQTELRMREQAATLAAQRLQRRRQRVA